ncbi:MAG: sensor histidine kinase [Actinomycetota bacterium]|nr:sensor histidine kinase [Actinomycetota bacterium]
MTSIRRRVPTWAIDTLLAAMLTAGAFVDLSQIDAEAIDVLGWRTPDEWTILAILLQTVPVAFRRRLPTTALVVASFGFFLDRNLNYPSTIAMFGLLFVFHAVGSELSRRRALVTGWTAIGLMTAFTFSGVLAGLVSIGTPLLVFVFTSFPFILGLESRERRAAEADLAVQAQRLEFEKAAVVRQERARIARELHDVVAHEMTVATLQAAAAQRLIGSDDEQAKKAAGDAERAGHEGLVELRRLLGMLRTSEPASRTPQPGLTQLDALIGQMIDAGLDASLEIHGDPRALPPGMDLNAYRIVQESLTNALKHGGPEVSATVTISYQPTSIEIEIVDDGRGAASSIDGSGSGQGLMSMRERSTILNGTFDAGPRSGGGFRVAVSIPCDTR